MKIVSFFLFLFIFCTSYSYAIIPESINSSNLIINSNLIQSDFSVISYENFILVPINKIFNLLNIEFKSYDNQKIKINLPDNCIELYSNSCEAYINKQKVCLVVPTILYNNEIYISTNLLNSLLDFNFYYDNLSTTLFIKDLSEFKQIEFFFYKIEQNLKHLNNIHMDIISEIIADDNSSYSIGVNIYIDRTLNKIFQKNMLEEEWKESTTILTPIANNNFNNSFFSGISLDRINSNQNQLIFYGYYPLDKNKICYSKIFINPKTLVIEKQINEFNFENNKIKQTIFYTTKKD